MWSDGSLKLAGVSGLSTALILVAVVAPLFVFGDSSLIGTVVIFLINVTLVIALQSFVGNSGILSFGHVAFMGVGAYVTAWLAIPTELKSEQLPELPSWLISTEWGFLPTMLAAGLVAGLLAALVGLVLVRMTVNAMVMATLALLLVVYTIWVNWTSMTRGSSGVLGIPKEVTPWLALAIAIVFVLLARLFKSSKIGLQLRASREDELAAGASGIDVRGVRYVSWIFSAVLMGMAGSFWAFNIIAFDPGQFTFAITFALLAMLILGGRESVLGAVIGALIISIVTEFFSRIEQGVTIINIDLPRITGTVQFVIALIIILVLIWRPEGVVGRREIEDYAPRIRELLRPKLLGRDAMARQQSSPVDQHHVILQGVGLSKSFKGLRAVDNVDIEVRPGEILGLIGPNGSGKSTLLNLLSGVTNVDAGEIYLNQRRVTGKSGHVIARSGLARSFQNIRLFSHLSVVDNVMAPHGTTYPSASLALREMGLAEVKDAMSDSLSYGLRRRLEIARAMSTSPLVVLLDEPAAGMNHSESDVLLVDIRTLAEEYRCGVIIIDHDLRLIMRLCDRIQVLEAGKTIAVGTPSQIAVDPLVAAAYLGDEAIDIGPSN